MSPLDIRSGVRRLFRLAIHQPERAPQDADDELRAVLEARIDHLIARGMPPDEARAVAFRRLGSPIDDARLRLHYSAKQRERQMRLRERLDDLAHDLRYGIRGLRLSPGFTVAVVIILGLGIGANAAMFQIVDRLLFRPPPYLRDAARTHQVYLYQTSQGKEWPLQHIGYRRYLDLARHSTSFAHTAAVSFSRIAVGVGTDAREMLVGAVSASAFELFNARPVIGRFFTVAEDATPAGTDVVVLGHTFWQTHYGGERTVLGQRLQIGPRSFTIIGVAPAGFSATESRTPTAFIPITARAHSMLFRPGNTDYYLKYNMQWMEMFALRRPDVSVEAATADLSRAFRLSYESQVSLEPSSTPIAVSRPRAVVGPLLENRGPNQSSVSRIAQWLVGVAAIVLLIACANVANLLLARALRRQREIAVRLALGVSRGRLLTQLFVESLLLALLGAGVGLALAHWGGGLLRSSFLSNNDAQGVWSDGRTLLFTMIAAVAVALFTGVAPALHALRSDVAGALKAGAREGGGSYHRGRLRPALLIAQGALSMVLLVGAGLFVRSVAALNSLPLGYDVANVLYVAPNMRGERLDSAGKVALRERLLAEARAIPGVVSATRTSTVPFYMSWNENLFVPGLDTADINKMGPFYLQTGSPEYFVTMGTRILRGRGFTEGDRAGGPRVTVVSEAMASALWPGQNPLGKCVKVGADTTPCAEVVGVAETIRLENFKDAPGLNYYLPVSQGDPTSDLMFLRVRGNAAAAIEGIRRRLQPLMPGVSYLVLTPMEQFISTQQRSWRLGATMFSLFGALALVIATFGLYGVVAYNVAQRRHELGLRVALGARSGDVVRLVLGQGVRVAAAGIVIGAAIAWWAGKYIAPLLLRSSPHDPAVFAVVSVVLLLSAVLACSTHAIRAARVDPASALRTE